MHEGGTAATRRKRAVELLDQVGIPDPDQRLSAYPHQLSGGMNQRVMIAMAIACNPRLLIADEPTTALDVTIQRQILELLLDLQRQRGMALVLITHNMGVVAETAHRVAVMYAGQVMEQATADEIFQHPHHPYTAALLDALPERSLGRRRLAAIPGVVPGLNDRPNGCLFNPRCRYVRDACLPSRPKLERVGKSRRALHRTRWAWCRHDAAGQQGRARGARPHAPLSHPPGLVPAQRQPARGRRHQPAAAGRRDSRGRRRIRQRQIDAGARVVTLIEPPTAGTLRLDGQDPSQADAAQRRNLRRTVQMVFQDPYGSLNPRRKVGSIIEEPLIINTDLTAEARGQRVAEMLAAVGLRPEHAERYPHMFSGGQRQRIAIARALVLNPRSLSPTSRFRRSTSRSRRKC